MEILYVIAGGGLVALGFFMANMGKKPETKPESKQEPMQESTTGPAAPEELPKSGQPISEQVGAILGYNPYQALKNGDK